MPIARTYRITAGMLKAGVAAMEQCRSAGGYTPQTACHAIFTAMLNAADSTPGADIRKSFAWSPHDTSRTTETHNGKTVRGVITTRPPLERPLSTYAGLVVAGYEWKGFHFRYRKHCFLKQGSDRDWIWCLERDWKRSDFEIKISERAFYVDAIFCWQHLKAGRITNK
jgi:hypothetical protein